MARVRWLFGRDVLGHEQVQALSHTHLPKGVEERDDEPMDRIAVFTRGRSADAPPEGQNFRGLTYSCTPSSPVTEKRTTVGGGSRAEKLYTI